LIRSDPNPCRTAPPTHTGALDGSAGGAGVRLPVPDDGAVRSSPAAAAIRPAAAGDQHEDGPPAATAGTRAVPSAAAGAAGAAGGGGGLRDQWEQHQPTVRSV